MVPKFEDCIMIVTINIDAKNFICSILTCVHVRTISLNANSANHYVILPLLCLAGKLQGKRGNEQDSYLELPACYRDVICRIDSFLIYNFPIHSVRFYFHLFLSIILCSIVA